MGTVTRIADLELRTNFAYFVILQGYWLKFMLYLTAVRTSGLWRFWWWREVRGFTSLPCRWRSPTFQSPADAAPTKSHQGLDHYPVYVLVDLVLIFHIVYHLLFVAFTFHFAL